MFIDGQRNKGDSGRHSIRRMRVRTVNFRFDTEKRLHSGIFDIYRLTVYTTYHIIAVTDKAL